MFFVVEKVQNIYETQYVYVKYFLAFLFAQSTRKVYLGAYFDIGLFYFVMFALA